jgi:hypothetical protein
MCRTLRAHPAVMQSLQIRFAFMTAARSSAWLLLFRCMYAWLYAPRLELRVTPQAGRCPSAVLACVRISAQIDWHLPRRVCCTLLREFGPLVSLSSCYKPSYKPSYNINVIDPASRRTKHESGSLPWRREHCCTACNDYVQC